MNFQSILFIGVIIELCFVPLLDAKRSFGLTRSRSKSNKGPAVRRNGHGHEYDDPPIPPPVKPSAPDMKKMSHNSPGSPQGPPPAYPGLGHQQVPHHNAPPAYGHPPSYSSAMGGGYHQPTGFASHPTGLNNFGSPYSGVGGGVGGLPMGVMPLAYSPQRSVGSGMMTNLFAGLAGYQLARAFGGNHHHRDHEVIVIDNRNEPAQGAVVPPPVGELPLNVPILENPTNTNHPMQSSTEIPQEPIAQVGPANNEYNHYGVPQYGIPLYGYSMPSQTTNYYQSATMSLSPQPPLALKK